MNDMFDDTMTKQVNNPHAVENNANTYSPFADRQIQPMADKPALLQQDMYHAEHLNNNRNDRKEMPKVNYDKIASLLNSSEDRIKTDVGGRYEPGLPFDSYLPDGTYDIITPSLSSKYFDDDDIFNDDDINNDVDIYHINKYTDRNNRSRYVVSAKTNIKSLGNAPVELKRKVTKYYYKKLTKWLDRDIDFRKLLRYLKIDSKSGEINVSCKNSENDAEVGKDREDIRERKIEFFKNYVVDRDDVFLFLDRLHKKEGVSWFALNAAKNKPYIKKFLLKKCKKLLMSYK